MAAACRCVTEARGFYDLEALPGVQDHQEAAGIVFQDTASVLFGVEGLQPTDAQAGPDGTLEVWAVTDYRPRRRARTAGRSRPAVMTRCWPGREMSSGAGTGWRCGGSSAAGSAMRMPAAARRSPSGCRRRRRGAGSRPGCGEQAGAEVSDRGITPAEAARHAGISWPVAHAGVRRRRGPGAGAGPGPGGAPGHR